MTATARKTVLDAPIEFVVAKLGLQLKRQGRELVGPCPVCGGHDRFAVSIAKQLWNCRGCCKGGDGIGLIRHVEGCSYREAVALLKGDEVRTFTASVRVQPAVDQQVAELRRVDIAGHVWTQAIPLGPEANAYFKRRGIDINAALEQGGLRFHPHCPWEGSTRPCVIARYTTAIGNQQRGIWRRPVTGEKPKALGPTAGCVIRLWPDDAIDQGLVLGEGVETVLSAATRIEHNGTLLQPAWSAGSAGNMANFPLLPGIESLTLLVDNDDAGERAADQCRARWVSAGCEVTLLMPNISNSDFNDVVLT